MKSSTWREGFLPLERSRETKGQEKKSVAREVRGRQWSSTPGSRATCGSAVTYVPVHKNQYGKTSALTDGFSLKFNMDIEGALNHYNHRMLLIDDLCGQWKSVLS
jgi:hypothetical protein